MRIFVLSTILAFSLGGCSFGGGKAPDSAQEEDHSRYNLVQFSPENPYVTLTPTQDARNINVETSQFGYLDSVEVEMTYFSKTVQQGVFDRIDLKNGVGEKQIFLGSCSESTGVRRCYFHEGVEKGVVNATYDDGEEKKKRISSEFHLQELTKANGEFESTDGKASVTVEPTLGILSVITLPVTGLPGVLPDGKTVEGTPYAFLPSREVQVRGIVRLDAGSDASSVTIYRWDAAKASWEALETTVNGFIVTSPTTELGLFAVGR
ncbi:MAG: hypothetical protein Q8R11_00215 [bacterium]|nr:hypothetical protein [bacterium]